MGSVDRIVDMIDAALDESPAAPVYAKEGTCWRCASPASDEVCGMCRAFLLGDSATDPATVLAPTSDRGRSTWTTLDEALASVSRSAGDTAAALHAAAAALDQRLTYWPPGMDPSEIRFRCEQCRCPDCERWLADHPSAVEHVGYRRAKAIAARYLVTPPPDPAWMTELLFVNASGAVLSKWWSQQDTAAPRRYRFPIAGRHGEMRTDDYELAGALWRDDGRRRLVYIPARSQDEGPPRSDLMDAMRYAFGVVSTQRRFTDITGN